MDNETNICRSKKMPALFNRIQIVFLVCLLFSNIAFAAGTLDPTFGNGGKVNVRFLSDSEESIGSAALQPDGKILIVGRTEYSATPVLVRDMVIARLNQDGSLDSTFGSGGWVTADFGFNQSEDFALAVFVQLDGKIVVGGFAHKSIGIARFNPNGSLDASFGSGGKVVTDFTGAARVYARFLLPQTDGKFIAVGSVFGDNEEQIALARYNSDGSLDSTFGGSGKSLLKLGRYTYLFGAAIDADNKLLISGNYLFPIPNCIPNPEGGPRCEGDESFLLRYKQNFTLDRKFGRRFGKEYTGQIRLAQLSTQADGSILANNGFNNKRYLANGRFERDFETPIFPNQSQNYSAGVLTQRPNGTIIGCGYASSNGFSDMGVVLFNTNGQVIATDQRDFFGANDSCTNILLQSDGKIVVVGRTQLEPNGKNSFGVIRFLDITP